MDIETTKERDEIARLNREGLARVLRRTGWTLPQKEYDKWRPTKETSGYIAGWEVNFTCLATDGTVGLFIETWEPENVSIRHVENFYWDTEETELVLYTKANGEVGTHQRTTDMGAPPTLHGKIQPAKSENPRMSMLDRALKKLQGLQEKI